MMINHPRLIIILTAINFRIVIARMKFIYCTHCVTRNERKIAIAQCNGAESALRFSLFFSVCQRSRRYLKKEKT